MDIMRFLRRLRAPLLGSACLAVVALSGRVAFAQVFEPETFILDNGMKVVVLPDHRSPVVHHMVWYKVGSADEQVGKSGLAHLLEHMMFKGTPTVPSGEFSKIVARNGGNDNAFTSENYTAYHQTIARDRLPMVMEMEADRMVNLLFSEEDFQTERSVVQEERRARTDTEPSAILLEKMKKALWGTYPYANPTIGWGDELSALTRDDALAFYRRFYGPDNAILVVAGDITAKDLKPLAIRTYGRIPPMKALPDRSRPSELTAERDSTITLVHPQVRQASVSRLYVAPALSNDPHAHAYPLQVLADVLGGGSTSRLYRSLVVDQKLAVSAGAWYSADALDYGVFGLYAVPREGVSIETLNGALDKEISKILDDGVTDGELARAVHRLTAGLVYARDSLSEGAQTMGVALTTGSSAEVVEAWPQRIKAVTSQQVQGAAFAVLGDYRGRVTGILLPQSDSRGEVDQ